MKKAQRKLGFFFGTVAADFSSPMTGRPAEDGAPNP